MIHIKKRGIRFFDKADQLHLNNTIYKECVHSLFDWFIKNDQISHDITTQLLFPDKNQTKSSAKIFSKGDITVAGIEEIVYFIDTFTRLKYTSKKQDGELCRKEETMIEIFGQPEEILIYERTILNLLQRFCGIATETHKNIAFMQSLKLSNLPQLAATRKTLWSLLDKKAVSLGGGFTHRLTLSDGILVKDNHLLLLKKQNHLKNEEEAVLYALRIAMQKVDNTLIEIEVENKESIPDVIEMFLSSPKGNVLGIMLDNFTPEVAKQTIQELQKYDVENIVFEASGGITSDNLSRWAQTGVDVISLGSLTHSAKAADISLEIII